MVASTNTGGVLCDTLFCAKEGSMHRLHRLQRLWVLLVSTIVLMVASITIPVALAASGTLLRSTVGLYPRVIRLEHSGSANGRILASVVSFSNNNGIGVIYESTNGGTSFTEVGTIADPEAANNQGLCCSTLYELPQQIGNNAAGTLLWAASVGQDEPNRRMALRIWKSTDLGRNWSYLSSCATATSSGGLWEPEFSVASDGKLVCHYSDETDSAYSQKLVEVRSSDGITWVDKRDTVASSLQSDRPGMAIVRKLPNNTYFMIYEICASGGQYRCVVHYRTSADGWDWGTATALGTRPETANGQYFKHAPTIAVANNTIFLIGQILYNADGSVAAGNGNTIWKNTQNGSGSWTSFTAPVAVPNPYDNYCPNYSSALLPSADASTILEIATDYDGGACKPYYASGSTTAAPSTSLANGVYTLTSKAGNGTFRLDVDACNATNGGKVQLWQPFNNDCQKWALQSVGGGYYTLTSKAGNGTFRLDVDACNATNGGKVQLWQPFDNDCQKWLVQSVGGGYYTLTSKAGNGTFRLDVDACNAINGGKVQLWQPFDNDCQKWKLESVS
jgi:Ricin-type beta-trefoil lectin domain-like